MNPGEFLTRLTIWMNVGAYVAGIAAFAIPGASRKWESFARIAWTIAALSLLAHLICAYQFYHQWSHAAAYLETARQTAEVTGLNWGGGIYINYLLVAGFMLDAAWWWWCGLESYRRRSWFVTMAWHSLVVFIIFNATVVFKAGAVRWSGLVICVILSVLWLKALNNRQKLLH